MTALIAFYNFQFNLNSKIKENTEKFVRHLLNFGFLHKSYNSIFVKEYVKDVFLYKKIILIRWDDIYFLQIYLW